MAHTLRIALIGAINRDTIRTPDGMTTESYGGLLYSILSLVALMDGRAEVFPVCNVGQDVQAVVAGLLNPLVRCDGVRFVPDRNNHCFLDYDAEGRKQETLQGGVPPLTFDRLSPFLTCDALCFNFITGFELSLETFEQVRASTDAPILMDVHSLTLGIDEGRRRYWRRPPDWERWIACARVVQMNEREAALMWGTDVTGGAEMRRFGERVLGLGPSVLVVTRGAAGSDALFRDADGGIAAFHAAAEPPGSPVDETGCGDVFLMAFTVEYLRSRDVRRASVFANRAAGANCCLRGIEEIGRIREYAR
ncbi:MAG: carbohydrate kinase family protein [Candidatus Latescibacteria bacterium]|nr:carbohydrate kinase family protein [Candidatus Latescibacterota bacterium]